jgi:hypothetical protein
MFSCSAFKFLPFVAAVAASATELRETTRCDSEEVTFLQALRAFHVSESQISVGAHDEVCGKNLLQDSDFSLCITNSVACPWINTFPSGPTSYQAIFPPLSNYSAMLACGAVDTPDVKSQLLSSLSPGSLYEVSWWLLGNGSPSFFDVVLDGVTVSHQQDMNTRGFWVQFTALFRASAPEHQMLISFASQADQWFFYLTGMSMHLLCGPPSTTTGTAP